MRIAVVGARLAGSYASLLLSRLGHQVLLLDHSINQEKPCGGGITSKALGRMSWFRENPLPHTEITTVRLTAPDGHWGDLHLRHPIHVFSRFTLDSSLRDAAVRAGTQFVPERALSFTPRRDGWAISTSNNVYEASFLVGADGATSSVRSAVARKYSARDVSLALGFYLPGRYHQNRVVTRFQENGFQGYLWSFPRVDHSSVGILQWLPFANARELRGRVTTFIENHYPEARQPMSFYAARIPCLGREALLRQNVCGHSWALLGDAAGFADAITAEGIYFALRSAELLVDALQRENPLQYEKAWRQDFGNELGRAAEWRDRFYGGTFLLAAFTRRAIQITRYSPTVQKFTDALICGLSDYDGLRRRLLLNFPRILVETIANRLRTARSSREEAMVVRGG